MRKYGVTPSSLEQERATLRMVVDKNCLQAST